MDMSRYLELFLSETREHLAAVEEALARLDADPGDEDTVRELFRHAHSIKGMAASMGYSAITELAHGIEDLFDALKKHEVMYGPVLRGAVARGFDRIGLMADRIETSRGPEVHGSDLLADLRALLPGSVAAPAPASAPISLPGGSGERLRIEVVFASDAALPAARAAVALKRLEGCGRVLGHTPSLAELGRGEFTGTLTALIETEEPADTVRTLLRGVVDVNEVRLTPMPLESVAAASPARTGVLRLSPQAPPEEEIHPPGPEKQTSPADDAGPAVTALTTHQAAPSPAPPPEHARDAATTGSVRVAADRLDRFLDTIGELTVQRSRLSGLVRGRLGRETDLALEAVTKLTKRLRDDVMALRMLPFDVLAPRCLKTVRELSESLGKRVSLRISGRDVRADRSVLENLVDPINHILRNALDHGIEPPAERAAGGKPEVATIELAVVRRGDFVIVRIRDDGRGMDVDRIKSAALEKGLVEPELLRTISDDDALMLATIPGISTAGRVTSVSGRGVGMDVVRTRVEALGGRLVLRSQRGAGTTVEMRLPLTIVVVPAFIVQAADRDWAVPLSSLHRTAEIRPGEIEHRDDRRLLATREGPIEMIELAGALGYAVGPTSSAAGRYALIVREGTRMVAVAVDRIVGRREIVVKPLRQPLEELRAYSGATLLENGRIALVLDLHNIAGL